MEDAEVGDAEVEDEQESLYGKFKLPIIGGRKRNEGEDMES